MNETYEEEVWQVIFQVHGLNAVSPQPGKEILITKHEVIRREHVVHLYLTVDDVRLACLATTSRAAERALNGGSRGKRGFAAVSPDVLK